MKNPKVGLLPLYIELYDQAIPTLLADVEPFVGHVQAALTGGGLEVLVAPISRKRRDFAHAVGRFEAAGVDAIITLHLAYSPSLESAPVLAKTALPVIMLDTTPDRDFGRDVDPMRLLNNHGVHGLQDLASVLRRLGKPYQVIAGHWEDSDVIQRCVSAVRMALTSAFANCGSLQPTATAVAALGRSAVCELLIQNTEETVMATLEPVGTITAPLEDDATSDNTQRAVEAECAARAAESLRSMRVLRVGGIFPGMGDFAVPDEVLRERLGITVENIQPRDLGDAAAAVGEPTIAAEIASDRKRFRVDCDQVVHARSIRVGLGLRHFLQRGGFGAFSINFMAFEEATGPVNTVPFLECCKAMGRGLGYAGEGDVLTATLVGALLRGFGPATFTEMFCPDWASHSLFLSHMGEINPDVAAAQPLLYEKAFPFTPALNPVALACAPRPGPATLVNLSPGPNDSYRLITAPVEVLSDGTHPDLDRWVRGWIRPSVPLPHFLEEFSRLGGTHHSALLFGDHREGLAAFSALLDIEHCPIS